MFEWLGRFFENDDKSVGSRIAYARIPIGGSFLALLSSCGWDHPQPRRPRRPNMRIVGEEFVLFLKHIEESVRRHGIVM
jgi:hypothetical protein